MLPLIGAGIQTFRQVMRKKYLCVYSPEQLNKHTEDCLKFNHGKIRMPEVGKPILKFKNHKNKEKAPFIICGDMESILKPIGGGNQYQ